MPELTVRLKSPASVPTTTIDDDCFPTYSKMEQPIGKETSKRKGKGEGRGGK
jgi:hypothetical protein